ncbi:MAG: hypothetical protein ACKO2Z_00805 [Sphaerospermopsis kisseleviana]
MTTEPSRLDRIEAILLQVAQQQAINTQAIGNLTSKVDQLTVKIDNLTGDVSDLTDIRMRFVVISLVTDISLG